MELEQAEKLGIEALKKELRKLPYPLQQWVKQSGVYTEKVSMADTGYILDGHDVYDVLKGSLDHKNFIELVWIWEVLNG